MAISSCLLFSEDEKALVGSMNSSELCPLKINNKREDITHPETKIIKSLEKLADKLVEVNNRPETPIQNRKFNIHKVLPNRNRAFIVAGAKTYDIVDYPYPTLENEDEVIILNCAIGLNPVDWKSVEYNFCLPAYPWITGREMSGIVVAVGANVKEFNIGDRVWTSTYYRDRRAGCFQHYVTVPQHTVTNIPDNLDFESAACLGVPGLTAAMTLWKWLKVPISSPTALITCKPSRYLLIWGGSTVTAQFMIQIATLNGLKVIAVTSKKTSPLALYLGAAHTVTRDKKTNSEIVSELRQLVGDNITLGVDLVGTETAESCLKAMSTTKPGIFTPLSMLSSRSVIPENITVETVEMKQFILNPDSKVYSSELNRLVSGGLISIPRIEALEGGLESIESGLEQLKNGDMGGKKLVVSMLK